MEQKIHIWFDVKSGDTCTCKQDSVISGFLFLIVMDWEKKKTVERNNRKRCNSTAVLEDIDFANNLNIALLSSTCKKKHI